MTAMTFTTSSPFQVARLGERRVPCMWAKLAHRVTDAASGV
jgi:hypothetical protein